MKKTNVLPSTCKLSYKQLQDILCVNGMTRSQVTQSSVYHCFGETTPRVPSKEMYNLMERALKGGELRFNTTIVQRAEAKKAKALMKQEVALLLDKAADNITGPRTVKSNVTENILDSM